MRRPPPRPTRTDTRFPDTTLFRSPKESADRMEQWFVEGAGDGFVISATHVPGTYEEFVKFVVPELQRRGLFRKEYTGSTLREHLGLDRPRHGAWRKQAG